MVRKSQEYIFLFATSYHNLLSLPSRCLSGSIPVNAGLVGGTSALHGAHRGSVHKTRSCPCTGHRLPTA